MPQINNFVAPNHGVAFFCIPKCANASIKAALHEAFGKKRYWDKYKIAARKDWATFAIVRDPFERAISTWAHKVYELEEGKEVFEYGEWFDLGMSFRDYCQRISEIPDDEIDVHFQSQAHMISIGGIVIPQNVYLFSNLPEAWRDIQGRIFAKCGVTVGDLPHLNATHIPRGDLRNDQRCRSLVRERYREDYDIISELRLGRW